MLDLEAIKARLDAATSWTGSGDSEAMHRLAAWDIASLIAEVERLRAAIKEHAWVTEFGTENENDLKLWEVLE